MFLNRKPYGVMELSMPNHTVTTQKIKNKIEYIDLPKKILENYEHPQLIDCILYELLDQNIPRVSLIAYNPDFYLCKGIAGICLLECNDIDDCPWNSPEALNALPFNKFIKTISFQTNKETSIDKAINNLQHNFLSSYTTEQYIFKLKNNNIGVLSYNLESTDENIHHKKEYLEHTANILGLCLF
jgi:hypothetical protein